LRFDEILVEVGRLGRSAITEWVYSIFLGRRCSRR